MTAAFTGFGPNALPFFKALAFHQDREWFQANRALYDTDVVAPMQALIADLTARFAEAGLPLQGSDRSLFRIHRDVRFSKDKQPYKTHAGAVMTRTGGKNDPGLLYLHIDPTGCFAAAGFHQLEPAALNTFRTHISRHQAEWTKLEKTLAKSGLELETDNQTSRIPLGFEALKGGPLDGAVRLKSFSVYEKLPDDLIASSQLPDAIAGFAVRARPLLDFGWKATGNAT